MNARSAFTRTTSKGRLVKDDRARRGETDFPVSENASKFHLSLNFAPLIFQMQLRFGPLTIAVGLPAC